MKRIIISLAVILAVGGAAAASTGAFFSDTETSTGNTFTAGSIDLTVDSTQHYNGMVCVKGNTASTWQYENPTPNPLPTYPVLGSPCDGTWSLTNLGPTNHFFNFPDIKPGDLGEDTVSLHIDNNPAWVCADLKVTSNADGAGGVTVAGTSNSDFEPAAYSLGNINQNGWSMTGAYDAAVSLSGGTTGFGTQSLRISDSVTSGSFGDQIFSPSLANEAGETTDALNNGLSGGTRQSHFEAQFDLASVLLALQTGMHVSVSPDRGDGARMSYLRFEDQADGIHIHFVDVNDPGPVGTVANFPDTDIATISRAPHTIKFVMDFVDGPHNDVVKIYIDGSLVHTGTSWEDYYRYDPESQGSPHNVALENKTRTVDSLLFRESGSADPGNAGNGFLIDNLALSSGSVIAGSGGALADGIQFVTWKDNGDNIHQQGEQILTGPAALGSTGTTTITLADPSNLPALDPSGTHYIGIAWCAGALTVNGDGSLSCNGATMGNEAQNDSMTADITLRAVQSRNNPDFSCRPK